MTAQQHDLWAARQFERLRRALANCGILIGFRRLLDDDTEDHGTNGDGDKGA